MNWIKNNAIALSLLSMLIGSGLLWFSNDYDITSKTISIVQGGKAIDNVVYTLSHNKIAIEIIASILVTLGLALFISAFFIRHIEKEERQEFEDKLLYFQKNTAKDAIQSVFKRIIENEFFKIIQKDVLNAKLLRKNANWQYDITIERNKPILKRTLSYVLHNISGEPVKEPIKITVNSTVHSEYETISGKIRFKDGKEETIELKPINTSGEEYDSNKAFKTIEKEIEVKPDEPIEVVLVFKQTFNNDYIFETHTSRHPVVGLEITINIPDGYLFELIPSFSTKPRLRVNEKSKKVYVIEGAIYQGQGIEFLCYKEST